MTETKLCEPCRRFVVGDLRLRDDYNSRFVVAFDHHVDFDSYKEAMQLPCSICTLAWLNAKECPLESDFQGVTAVLLYGKWEDTLTLRFWNLGPDYKRISSACLVLQCLPTSTDVSIGRTLPSNTREALPFLLKQYHDCCADHVQCGTPESAELNQYPSRLLDVGHEGSPIILRSAKMFSSQEYVCLSHCWGNSKPYTLNSKTQQDLEKGIDAENLPKTFRDAIHVINQFEHRIPAHISSCIIQDSEPDWEYESSRMEQVYAHAACTIAATASGNSDGGLFFERHPQQSLPRLLDIHFNPDAPWLRNKAKAVYPMGTYLCDIEHMTTYCIERAPLNSRAWVSQERQLSRRIMHFSDSQVFWECYGSRTCETYPNGIPREALPYWYDDATMLKRRLHEFSQQCDAYSNGIKIMPRLESGLDDRLYWAWCSFRVHYSRSALTRDSDKLVALCGIAKQVGGATGDELVAGLWKSRMIEELCWFILRFPNENLPVEPTEWRAPTWSWAASNGYIWMSSVSKYHSGHKSRHFETELIDLDIATKLSGELTYASMRIRCRPMLATLIPDAENVLATYEFNYHLVLMEDDVHLSDAKLGGKSMKISSHVHTDDPTVCEPQQIYIIVIQRCFHENHVDDDGNDDTQNTKERKISGNSRGSVSNSDEEDKQGENDERDTSMLEGLLLQSRGNDSATFSRVGTFLVGLSRGDPGTIFNAHLNAEERIITLV